MEGSQRPRRAAGPLPADWNEPTDSPAAARPAGPLFDDPDELTDTGMMRRLAFNADGSLPPLAVPPPRPVLPTSEAAPASAGRRFSADDAPFIDDWVAPRRSAASVSSPPAAYEPLLPPLTRPTAPPSRTVSYSSAAEPPPEAYLRSMPADPTAPTPTPAAPPRSRASARSQATPPTRAMEPETKPSRRDAKAAEAAARSEAKAAQEAEKAAAKQAAQQAKLDARSAKADAKADAKAAKAQPSRSSSRSSSAIPASRLAVGNSSPVATPSPAAPRKGSAKVVIIVLAVILAVAVILGGVAWGMGLIPGAAKAPTAPTASDPLVTATDVTPLAAGPWQESTVASTPVCLGEGVPAPERTGSRKLFDAANDSALQLWNVYPDDAAATQAYDAISVLAGTCADGAGMVAGASSLSGLADAAQAVQITVQSAKPENHLLLITRTGRNVNVFDFVTAAGAPVTTAAQVATASLNRQCGAGGTCPTSVSVAAWLPAPGSPAGWLVPADLPRITMGAGKWNATDWPAITTPGSECEGTDLTKVANTTAAAQRTLILTGDPKAPTSFGIDQVTYTFADAKPANTLATGLIKSISGCQLGTATVVDGPDVRGVGAGGATISGRTWEITHKTNTSSFIYRVAVVTAGNRVTYLLATPSKTFDFTDADWTAIALRAGQRITQAG